MSRAKAVMLALVASIYVLNTGLQTKTWMVGTSPTTTVQRTLATA
jgi:hypothetical protein